jgi:Sec-independent protein translocase protein TatA
MELFGVGIWEILLIVLIALIVLGPQDTVKAGRNLGRAVRRFFSSEEWRTMLKATKEIRTIPDKLLEETGLDHPEEFLPSEEEIRKEAGLDDLERDMSQWKADLSSMSKGTGTPPELSNQILPPSLPSKQEIRQESGLADVEQDLSEWKADISAWGTSKVIIPVPSAAVNTPSIIPAQTTSESTTASTEQGSSADQTAPQGQTATQEQTEPVESAPSSPAPSTTSEQGQK